MFDGFVFSARETVDMPAPGDTRPARHQLELRDLVWEIACLPVARAVQALADLLNRMQFLSIQQYLSLVFAALVLLLLTLAIWT